MAKQASLCYRIRDLRVEETPLLETFLYEAIFIPDGVTPPPRIIVHDPSLYGYIDGFGSGTCDYALAAVLPDDTVVGVAWTRLLPDHAPLANDVPTLAIAVLPGYRGHGIGTALIHAIIEALAHYGYSSVSLSVQKANPALRLYQRAGFMIAQDNGEELVMVRELKM